MYENIEARGIVLDTSLLKEYDKRLVILTENLGRITVFANGARRKNSPLTAISQKFVMGTFKLRPSSQNSYTLVSADITESFRDLSMDIEKMAYASYISEVAGYFTQDGIPAGTVLNLLFISYNAILKSEVPLRLIKSVFECKVLDIEGLITLEEIEKVYKPRIISPSARYALEFVLSRKIAETYTFSVKEEIIDELFDIMSKYLKSQSDRHFKSLDILDTLL